MRRELPGKPGESFVNVQTWCDMGSFALRQGESPHPFDEPFVKLRRVSGQAQSSPSGGRGRAPSPRLRLDRPSAGETTLTPALSRQGRGGRTPRRRGTYGYVVQLSCGRFTLEVSGPRLLRVACVPGRLRAGGGGGGASGEEFFVFGFWFLVGKKAGEGIPPR